MKPLLRMYPDNFSWMAMISIRIKREIFKNQSPMLYQGIYRKILPESSPFFNHDLLWIFWNWEVSFWFASFGRKFNGELIVMFLF
jgi:hypothetical protein